MPSSGTLNYSPAVSGMIEYLVYSEGHRLHNPGMDFLDVAQEIRMACLKAMHRFDPSRIAHNNPNPFPLQFFRRCVRNHFYNMNRGTYLPNNPPCTRCPLWDKAKKVCVIDEKDCDKIVEYRKKMATKAAIRQPAHLEGDFIDGRMGMDINALILDSSIRSILPKTLINDYDKMLSGDSKAVPSKNKTKIRKIVRELLNDG